MVAIVVVTGVLVVGLAIVTTAAAYVGLLGIAGAVRFVRCDRCGHLGMTSVSEPLRSCASCRHGRLLHPLLALHHADVAHDSHQREAVTGS
jgi:hypothetical protein